MALNFLNITKKSWDGWDIAYGILTGGVSALIKMGVQSYQASKEAELAAKEMEKLSKANSTITALPYLKGASNTVATGKTQPYLCGRNLMTPYILNGGGNHYKGFSTISGDNGENQFYNVVLQNGFNKQIIEKLFCDDILLKVLDGEGPQEGIFYFDNNSVFASEDSFMEIAQDGNQFEFEDFNKKIVEETPNAQLLKANNDNYEDLFYTLEQNSRAADVCIMFNGLSHTTENGTKGTKKRTINCDWSPNYAQIKATGGNEADIIWRRFGFKIATWHPPVTTTSTGIYEYSINVDPKYDAMFLALVKKIILENISKWNIVKGVDVRADYDSFDFKLKSKSQNTYTFTITLKKTTTVPGYYDGETITNEIEGNFSTQVRYNAHVEFDDYYDEIIGSNYPITIRISTPDNTPVSGSDTDDCYIQWIHSYCYNAKDSEASGAFIDEKIISDRCASVSTLIGIHIKSTSANENKLTSLQVVSNGLARVYKNGEWTSERVRTDNPAAWLLEVLTSDKHIQSQLDDSEIDLDDLGTWFNYCAGNGFTFNYIITDGLTKKSILQMILDAGHAAMYKDPFTGLFTVAIDSKKEVSKAVLNEQNLISFNYTKELNRKVDGLNVTYINAVEDFQQDSFVLMYDRYKTIEGETVDLWKYPEERGWDCTLEEITLNGVEYYNQALREALFRMRCAKLRLKTATAHCTDEMLKLKPLDKVSVQHPALKVGLGSTEIKAIIKNDDDAVTGLELYSSVPSEADSIVIQCSNTNSFTVVKSYITADGSNEIVLDEPITGLVQPKAGDLISFGNGESLVTSEWLVTSITPAKNGYTLTLAEYNDEIYEDTENIPVYNSHLSKNKNTSGSVPSEVPSVYPSIEQVAEIASSYAQPIKTLSSLMDPGSIGEVAVYQGAFFKYDGSKWNRLDSSGYLGVLDYFPETATIDSFFICNFNARYTSTFELSNGEAIELSVGDVFEVTVNAKKGFIYAATTFGWSIIEDRNDYRYIMAMNDLAKYGFDLPEYLPEIVAQTEPAYLGALVDNPATYKEKDWFTWAGETNSDFTKGKVYRLENGYWVALDESNTANSKELMTALNDILATNEAGTGYFSSLFAKSLISNEAFINKLATSVIKLQADSEGNKGVIYGGNRYKPDGTDNDVSAKGFYLDEEGILKTNEMFAENSSFKHIEIKNSNEQTLLSENTFIGSIGKSFTNDSYFYTPDVSENNSLIVITNGDELVFFGIINSSFTGPAFGGTYHTTITPIINNGCTIDKDKVIKYYGSDPFMNEVYYDRLQLPSNNTNIVVVKLNSNWVY